MRTSVLALCLFLFTCRATSFIIDTDGEPVLNAAGAYHLIPISNDLNGRLGLATVGNDTFPKTVILDTNLNNGLPVRFISPHRILYIHSGLFLHIIFVSSAPELAEWKVEEEFPIGWTVKVKQETTTLVGPFRVEPAKTGYKIVYHPHNAETGADLGIVHKDGIYRLVVKDGDPFIFKIQKATESSARTMSIV